MPNKYTIKNLNPAPELREISNIYFTIKDEEKKLKKEYENKYLLIRKEFDLQTKKIQEQIKNLNKKIDGLIQSKSNREPYNIKKPSYNNSNNKTEIKKYKELTEKSIRYNHEINYLKKNKIEISNEIALRESQIQKFKDNDLHPKINEVLKTSERNIHGLQQIFIKTNALIKEIEKSTLQIIKNNNLNNKTLIKAQEIINQQISSLKFTAEQAISSIILSKVNTGNNFYPYEHLKDIFLNSLKISQKKIASIDPIFLKKIIDLSFFIFIQCIQLYIFQLLRNKNAIDHNDFNVVFYNDENNLTTHITKIDKINKIEQYTNFFIPFTKIKILDGFLNFLSFHLHNISETFNINSANNRFYLNLTTLFEKNILPNQKKYFYPIKTTNLSNSEEVDINNIYNENFDIFNCHAHNNIYKKDKIGKDCITDFKLPNNIALHFINEKNNSIIFNTYEYFVSPLYNFFVIQKYSEPEINKIFRNKIYGFTTLALLCGFSLYYFKKNLLTLKKSDNKFTDLNEKFSSQLKSISKSTINLTENYQSFLNSLERFPKKTINPLLIKLNQNKNLFDFHNNLKKTLSSYIDNEIIRKSEDLNLENLQFQFKSIGQKILSTTQNLNEVKKQLEYLIHHQSIQLNIADKELKTRTSDQQSLSNQIYSIQQKIETFEQIIDINREILSNEIKALQIEEQKALDRLADELSNHPIHTQNDDFREKINHCITEDAWHRVQLRHIAINDNELKSRLQTGSFQNPMGCEINSNANFAAGSYSSFEHAVYAIADASTKFRNKVDSTTFGAEISDRNEVTLSIKHDKPVGRLALKVQGKSPRIDCVDIDSSQVSFIKNGFDWKIAHIHPCPPLQ